MKNPPASSWFNTSFLVLRMANDTHVSHDWEPQRGILDPARALLSVQKEASGASPLIQLRSTVRAIPQ